VQLTVSGFFATLPVRPLACLPPGSFAPWLIRPLACSPFGLFAPWFFRPLTLDVLPPLNTDNSTLEVNQPGGEQARGERARRRTIQRANQPGTGSEQVRGEKAKRRISQGANKPGGEQARERTGKGAKKP